MVGGTWVEVLSFLTVNVDIELEILVVTSTILDVFTGSFVKGVGFVVLGFGFVTLTVDPAVDDNGLVLSVVAVVLVCSGLVVFVVVLMILVGFNFVVVVEDEDGLAVVEDNGLTTVDMPIVVLVVVNGLAVVVLIVDDLVVVFNVVFGVVVLTGTV